MAQHELSWSQGRILEYLQKFGKTLDGDAELANKLGLGYGSTVNQSLKKLVKYRLVEIEWVAGSRIVRITDLGKRHLIIDEELKGKPRGCA